ncbi:MAG: transketolase family protein [Candidatus Abyssobacteria bacterium SURF_17]|uniref:Transketolase family protein n=1 Tax=Candidatus Abyssobacteria bacterium SURF_17 TaxID=2093361 RepID=A0A419ESX0_9BACT|nr:MAG: transketolase family protein [Candidatus Abyssubacteria bacterium SURF_17]
MAEGMTFTIHDLDMLTQAEVYGKALVELGRQNKNVVVLTADLMRSNKTGEFAAAYPERFFNVGVAEQNLFGIAAGLARAGKIPFASTFAAFASMRACEQVRTDIAYNNVPVKIVATHSGLSMGTGGPTHFATEDIAIMRAMPNMTVIVPADSIETARAVAACVDLPGPAYIRIGRGFEPAAYEDENYDYTIGKSVLMRDGSDITLICCGVAVNAGVIVSSQLEGEGVSVRVINMHTIKPLDREAVVKAAKETRFIITAEEHNIIGGLGSAVAEVLAEEGAAVKLKRLGVRDEYSEIGYPEALYNRYNLDSDSMSRVIAELKEQRAF